MAPTGQSSRPVRIPMPAGDRRNSHHKIWHTKIRRRSGTYEESRALGRLEPEHGIRLRPRTPVFMPPRDQRDPAVLTPAGRRGRHARLPRPDAPDPEAGDPEAGDSEARDPEARDL